METVYVSVRNVETKSSRTSGIQQLLSILTCVCVYCCMRM